jgi:hypothetical protein
MLASKTAKSAVGALALMALLASASAASANTRTFRVPAGSTRTATLTLCSPQVWVGVEGDHDTDVDFDIYNPYGRNIHSDYDSSDITWRTVRRTASGCSDYQLVMRNLGGVYNDVTVTLEDL